MWLNVSAAESSPDLREKLLHPLRLMRTRDAERDAHAGRVDDQVGHGAVILFADQDLRRGLELPEVDPQVDACPHDGTNRPTTA